ncbi:predicted protein [Uncinocarpus reesii 1704]|uniref:Uncharacterized protein n=1 Tax=Uncinocarpus reesii (strain UAMH 1704) TaxID=336963 RepID=C4JGL6_UNCRE|nr:uncharacterized protein UREG_02528 [Uncinocarpus reesii 1704]EEP77679.1 predicted protein [Uncinocarpus reesii 1704]
MTFGITTNLRLVRFVLRNAACGRPSTRVEVIYCGQQTTTFAFLIMVKLPRRWKVKAGQWLNLWIPTASKPSGDESVRSQGKLLKPRTLARPPKTSAPQHLSPEAGTEREKVHEVPVGPPNPPAVERLAKKDARNRHPTFYDKNGRLIAPAQCLDAAVEDGTNTVFMEFKAKPERGGRRNGRRAGLAVQHLINDKFSSKNRYLVSRLIFPPGPCKTSSLDNPGS